MASFRAIVFDFDGVIVQSIEQHADAYATVLNPRGASVERRDVLLREGARSETIIRDLMGDAGIELSDAEVDELANRKQEAFRAMGAPSLYPDAEAMLEAAWATGAKTAIVTGTRRTNLESLIPDLLPRFDAVISQESYSHDKPHPEPYLTAAAKLKVSASACIGVENAIRGVESLHAAEYGRILAITTTLAAADLEPTAPDVLCPDHAAVTAAIREAFP